MTVSELLEALAKYPAEANVVVTWESTFHEPSIYVAKNGTVIIDADGDFYREDIEAGRWSHLIP